MQLLTKMQHQRDRSKYYGGRAKGLGSRATCSQRGFTLVEVLFTLSIVAILTLVTVTLLKLPQDENSNVNTKALLRDASSVVIDWPNSTENNNPGDWSLLTATLAKQASQDSDIIWEKGDSATCTWNNYQKDKPVNVCLTINSPGGDSEIILTTWSKSGQYYCVGMRNNNYPSAGTATIQAYQEASLSTTIRSECTTGFTGSSNWTAGGWLETGNIRQ